jgi:hypothetical protein
MAADLLVSKLSNLQNLQGLLNVCTDVASNMSKTYLAQQTSSWEFLHQASFSAVTFASYFACADFVLAKVKR